MANLTLPSPSRRSFLTSFLGAATVLRSAAPSMHWALLSDTHIAADPSNTYRGFKPFDNLKKIVPEIVAARPQGALICGDVARLIGEAADYRQVQSLLQPLAESTPIAMALGNHDDRKNFSSVLGATQQGAIALKDRHLLAIESPIARFLILDSLVTPNSTPGFLGKAQRSWLDDFLRSSSNLPTLLFVHHTLDDNDGALLDAPRLLDIAKRHPKVKAIIYGHSHRYYYETWENIHLINLPAVGYNFNDNEPVGWVDTTLSPTGAHFTLKAFGGNTAKNGQTTELKWLR